jgi:hypothetical protein
MNQYLEITKEWALHNASEIKEFMKKVMAEVFSEAASIQEKQVLHF